MQGKENPGRESYHKALEYYGLTMAPWNSDDEFVYPEAEECLRKLSEKYKIGIIANQIFGSEERLEKIGLLKYINLVVASAEEGVTKPDLRIFEIALSKADCKDTQIRLCYTLLGRSYNKVYVF